MIELFVSQAELIRWTTEAVAIPSCPGTPNQEAAVGAYLKGVFDAEGIPCRIDPLPDGRCNVIAVLKGTGGGRSLMLNGHMDTVPPYDMEDAFTVRREGEKMIGRGVSDMKGPLCAMMGALISIRRSGKMLRGDLVFTGVADEEEGSLGTIALIESGLRADGAIVGEPLGRSHVAVAQKGLEWYEFTFTGRTVHGGSQETGVNAILMANRFITAVEAQLLPLLKSRSHPLLGHPSLNIGVIRGGTQLSTVPGQCIVQLDRRFLPEETYEQMGAELRDILDELSRQSPDFRGGMRVLESSVMKEGYVHQSMETPVSSPLVQAVMNAARSVTGEAEATGCPCWTDAALLSHYAHIPSVVYAEGGLETCHSKEEYILPRQLTDSCRVYVHAAEEFCG